jgi:serine/threonine-protein kinase
MQGMTARELHRQRAEERIGSVLRGKYRLERILGVGGMATVYRAVHRNGSRVAVKVLHPELSLYGDVRVRFLREGYAANSIDHRGAVRVIDDDVGEDGAAFLVMELLLGETLDERARRRGGRLACREVLAIGHQLLDVLAAAHEHGVVHRDIKPENLFLTSDRVVKVLDFGIARILDDPGPTATFTGSRVGTPAFMPPEQALGRRSEVDARSDLWSAGATMFTLLTARFVHEGESSGEIVVRAATQPAPSLAEVLPEVPADVAALVDRALRFARPERWQSARAMQEELARTFSALYAEPVAPSAIGSAPAAEAPPAPGFAPLEMAFGATQPDTRSFPHTPESDPTRPDTDAAPDLGAAETAPAAGVPAVPSIAPTLPAARPAPAPQDPRASTSRPSQPASEPAPSRIEGARRSRRSRLALVALLLAIVAGTAFVGSRPKPRAPDAAAPARCAGHRACVQANGGKPAICRADDGACVAIESEDCHVLASPGDVENDATIWVGAMFPQSGPDAALDGLDAMRSVDLARRDFAELATGLPPARPGGPRRPLAVVACDDAPNAARAAAHLVDLRVPAILGFARSKEVIDLADALFLPKGVMALAANTSSLLKSIPRLPGEPRLVWRVTSSTDMMVPPKAALVSDVFEPELRSVPGLLAPGEPIRVAVARVNNTSGLSQTDDLVSVLRFNGKSVAENGASFRVVGREDASDQAQLDRSLERAGEEIAAFRPHIVVDASVLSAPGIAALERSWPKGERFRPRYVLGTLAVKPLDALVAAQPDLRRRILGVDMVATKPANVKLALHTSEVFGKQVSPQDVVGPPYDAFYTLAYAIAALGDAPVTGPALSRAVLDRLTPPGEPIEVGPAGIYPALHALASGQRIDLDGTATTLDFDPETGDASADFAVFCIGPGGHGDARDVMESGLVFSARTRRLTGSMRCR